MNRAEMAVAFGRGCGFVSGRLLGATGPRMESYNWKAKPISPCLGAHGSAPKNYFVWGCFPKIEWAPAYDGLATLAGPCGRDLSPARTAEDSASDQSGRGTQAIGSCRQPTDTRAAQSCLRLRIACQRSDPAQGQAHRQRAKDHSHRAGQRPQGSIYCAWPDRRPVAGSHRPVSRPTFRVSGPLLLDEGDNQNIFRDGPLRAVFNSGHRRGSNISRFVGGWTRRFSTFAPLAIAAIGTLPLPLLHRAVVINMQRRPADVQLERLDKTDPPRAFAVTREMARNWAARCPKNYYFVWGCFPKIEWAPAYDGLATLAAMRRAPSLVREHCWCCILGKAAQRLGPAYNLFLLPALIDRALNVRFAHWSTA
jgi:hypothetical protein